MQVIQKAQKALWAATLIIVSGCAATDGARTGEGESLSVSVPTSRLTMTFPKGNWARQENAARGSAAKPNYFYFSDTRENGLALSGWFEPEHMSIGLAPQWQNAQESWKKQGVPAPFNVSFQRLGIWDAVLYDRYTANGISSHLRGHRVQAGTWIDLHISATTRSNSGAENREVLKRILQDIVVTEK